MKTVKYLTATALMLTALDASAHCMERKFYAGVGMMATSHSEYDDSTGFQVFGGYCLNLKFRNHKVKTSMEAGFAKEGTFDRGTSETAFRQERGNGTVVNQGVNTANLGDEEVSGVWTSGILEYKFQHNVHALGRVGYDLGDDDGFIIGGGLGFNISKWAQVRTEYVKRSETDSLQVNLLSEF